MSPADPHPPAGVLPGPWTCPVTVDLSRDRGAVPDLGYLAEAQPRPLPAEWLPSFPSTCPITMNLPDGLWTAPGLACCPAEAVGPVPAARPCPASPGGPHGPGPVSRGQLHDSPALGSCLPAARGPAWPLATTKAPARQRLARAGVSTS